MLMTQDERLGFLIDFLQAEKAGWGVPCEAVPSGVAGCRALLRALMNVRPPAPISEEFLAVQEAYLQKRLSEDDIVDIDDLSPIERGVYLWQGDITRLRVDAIVNAANSRLLGCFVPGHHCIDNAIHTFAGIQLRLACAELMRVQEHDEPTGKARITPAFNLPCDYVLHTVGPVVNGVPSAPDRKQLASSYRSCLRCAEENGIASIAFCCISTGVFGYPQGEAARVAVATVREHLQASGSDMKVVFDVFSDNDRRIYESGLS